MNNKTSESYVAVVLNARNEEKHIEQTLIHLQNQDLKPYRIIVVNDGSTDKTEEVVSKFKEIEIVNRPKRKENFVAKKELAYTVNAGLAKLQNDKNCEYVLLMSAEILLPKDYLSKIISRMEEDSKLVITAGVVKDEFASVPRGPGRVIKYDFWKKLGLEFPVNYGYEAYQLWKAQSMGYKIASYSDIISETPRKTGSEYNPKLYYYYGLGLKALGYTLPYTLARVCLFAKRKPKGAYNLLKGFFSNYNELYEPELREYVRKTQHYNILHFNQGYLERLIKTMKHAK